METVSSEAALPTNQPRGRLVRVLGVGFGVAVTIGGVIGMGILRTPGEVAAQLPRPWLFINVWLIGGLYALLGTINVAELGGDAAARRRLLYLRSPRARPLRGLRHRLE